MSQNPTFAALPASVSLLDDSNTTAISYTAPFTTASNNTCYGGTCTSFQDANGALQFRFAGTNIWVFGKTDGLVRVFVDGEFVKTIDATLANSSFPNDSLKQPALWASKDLDAGTHTLKLAGVPGKNLNLLIDFFAINGTVITSNGAYNPTPAEARRLTGIIVGTLFTFFAVVAILGFLCFFVARQRKKRRVNHNTQPSEKGPISSSESTKETTTTLRGSSGRWSFFYLGLGKFLERKRNTFPLITIVRQPTSPAYYDTAHSYSTYNSTFAAQDASYPPRQPYSIDQALLQPEAMSPPATSTTTGDEDPFRTRGYVVPAAQASTSIPSPTPFVGGFSSRPRPRAPYEPPVSASSGSVYSMPAFGEPTGGSRVQQNPRYPPLDVRTDVVNADTGRVSEEMDEATPLVEKPPTYPQTSPMVPINEKSASGGAGGSSRSASGRRRALEEEGGGYATYGVSSFSPATPTPAYTSWSHSVSSPMPLNARATSALTSIPSNQPSRMRPPPASGQAIPVVAISAPLGSSKAIHPQQPTLYGDEERPPSFDAHYDFERQTRVSLPQPPPAPGPNVQSFRVTASPSGSLSRGVAPVSPVSPSLSPSSGSVRGPRPHRKSTLMVNEGTNESMSSAVPPRAKEGPDPRRKEGRQRGRRGGSDPESPLDPAVVFMWR